MTRALALGALLALPAALAACAPGEVSSQGGRSASSDGDAISMAETLNYALKGGLECNDRLVTAGAVAKAESGLQPEITNKNTNGTTDWGLWQINDGAHPEWTYDEPDTGKSRLCNPEWNAKAMVKISDQGTDWRPWVAYNKGAHKKFLPEAREAYAEVCNGNGAGLRGGDEQGGDPAQGDPAQGQECVPSGDVDAYYTACEQNDSCCDLSQWSCECARIVDQARAQGSDPQS